MSAGMSAGSGRNARLDPFALPVRYKSGDPGADERERIIEICRDRVVMQRARARHPDESVDERQRLSRRRHPHRSAKRRIRRRHRGHAGTSRSGSGGAAVCRRRRPRHFGGMADLGAGARPAGAGRRRRRRACATRSVRFGRVQRGKMAQRRRGRAVLRTRRGIGRLRRKPGVVNAASCAIYDCEREIIARD